MKKSAFKAPMVKAYGVALVMAATLLTGCATAPQGYLQPQFQGSVDIWDQDTEDFCHQVALVSIAHAWEQAPEPKPSKEAVEEAMQLVFDQCVVDQGRQI